MPLLPDGGNYKGQQFIAGNGATNSRVPGTMYANGLVNQYQQQLQGQLASNYGQYLGNVGVADAVYNQTLGGAQQSADSDLARLGEQQYRDVDLARLANQYLGDYQTNMYNSNQGAIRRNQGALTEQFQADAANAQAIQDYLNGRRDLTNEQYNSTIQYLTSRGINLGNLQSFANREFDIANMDAQNQYANNLMAAQLQKVQSERGVTSDATARGAMSSVGLRQDLGDIGTAFGLTQEQLTDALRTRTDTSRLGLDRATNDIGQQRNAINNDIANTAFGYRGDIASLQEQMRGNQFQQDNNYRQYQNQFANLGDQFQQNQYQYNYQQGQNDITSKTIDSVAREYGIREGDVNNALNQAVSRAGLDYNNTINQLNQMLASGNAQAQTQAQNFLAALLAQA